LTYGYGGLSDSFFETLKTHLEIRHTHLLEEPSHTYIFWEKPENNNMNKLWKRVASLEMEPDNPKRLDTDSVEYCYLLR